MALSYAQVCSKANGVEIVKLDGIKMSHGLALDIQMGKKSFDIHRQQLRATEEFISTLQGQKTTVDTANQLVRDYTPPEGLMDLPYDARHSILEMLVDQQTIRVFLRGDAEKIRLPVVARAGNKQLRRECLLVTLKNSTLEIHSGPGNASLQAWLTTINLSGVETSCRSGFDAIRSLSFPYFSRFPYSRPNITVNNDILLCKKCKSLRSVSINFHGEELMDRCSFTRKTVAALRDNYQLDGLLELGKLEELQIVSYASEPMMESIRELMAWFEHEFEKLGRKVAVKLN